jgi:tRNA (guanine9-N1)-methyltransferase
MDADCFLEKPKRPCYTRLPVAFVIDCGFDDLMTEREMISLGSQLTRSYSDNHKAQFQAHLFVSSWGGQLRERFNTVLEKHHENWRGVTFIDEDFVEAAARAKELMNGSMGGKLVGTFAIGQNDKIGAPGGAKSSAELLVEKGAALKEQDTAAEEPYRAVQGSRKQEKGVSEKPPMAPAEDPKEPQYDITEDPIHATNGGVEISEDVDAGETAQTPKFQAEKEGEVVYLTSDSPHTLERLQPYSTYIIGGLVDKNRHKGICYKTACDRGIKTAKLPIGEFMEMQSRFVLATNHVVEIMLCWLECGDWGQSFVKVMPKRKGGVLKAACGSKQDEHGFELEVEDMAPRSGDDEEATADLEPDDIESVSVLNAAFEQGKDIQE